MSKEHIGRNLVATSLTLGGIAMGYSRYQSIEESWEYARQAIPPIVEHVNNRYGVELAFQISEYERDLGIPFEEPLPIDGLRAAQVVQEELSLLPPHLVKAIGPRRVVISHDLGGEGLSIRSGFTFGECRFVYLSARKGVLTSDISHKQYLAHIAEHEFQHVVDALDDYEIDNVAWNKLSLPDTGSFHFFRQPGFVSDYAETDPDENQAEVAALLFNQNKPEGLKTYDQIDDPIILAKIAEMKHRYLEWSGGAINEQYWIDLRAGLINEAYWDERDTNRN